MTNVSNNQNFSSKVVVVEGKSMRLPLPVPVLRRSDLLLTCPHPAAPCVRWCMAPAWLQQAPGATTANNSTTAAAPQHHNSRHRGSGKTVTRQMQTLILISFAF